MSGTEGATAISSVSASRQAEGCGSGLGAGLGLGLVLGLVSGSRWPRARTTCPVRLDRLSRWQAFPAQHLAPRPDAASATVPSPHARVPRHATAPDGR